MTPNDTRREDVTFAMVFWLVGWQQATAVATNVVSFA